MLTAHQGIGTLRSVRPELTPNYEVTLLTPELAMKTLRPGRIYTLRADEETTEPFVVSGLYKGKVDWDKYELPIAQGQTVLETDTGQLTIPSETFGRF